MSDALNCVLYLLKKWLGYVFNDMAFQWNLNGIVYSASFGWLIVGALVIGMIIQSILNIPRGLPSNAFYSKAGRFDRDYRRYRHRALVREKYDFKSNWRK